MREIEDANWQANRKREIDIVSEREELNGSKFERGKDPADVRAGECIQKSF